MLNESRNGFGRPDVEFVKPALETLEFLADVEVGGMYFVAFIDENLGEGVSDACVFGTRMRQWNWLLDWWEASFSPTGAGSCYYLDSM